jgi:thymidylate kinase
MIINIRGTSGAGKSTLARRVMSLYPVVTPHFVKTRRPKSLLLTGAATGRPLFVLGHYEIACGGGDTVPRRDEAFGMLTQARDPGFDVLFEGVVHSDEVRRTLDLFAGHPGAVVLLDTPIETCIARILARRTARGQTAPLNETNTRARVSPIERACERLKAANIPVVKLNADEAFKFICTKLGMP